MGQDNVFTLVCHSVRGDGSVSQHAMGREVSIPTCNEARGVCLWVCTPPWTHTHPWTNTHRGHTLRQTPLPPNTPPGRHPQTHDPLDTPQGKHPPDTPPDTRPPAHIPRANTPRRDDHLKRAVRILLEFILV